MYKLLKERDIPVKLMNDNAYVATRCFSIRIIKYCHSRGRRKVPPGSSDGKYHLQI